VFDDGDHMYRSIPEIVTRVRDFLLD
jgi:hypothetical protein